MKKYFIPALAAVALGFTACSSEEPAPAATEGQSVTICFSAELPAEYQSRSFDQGEKAKYLTYAVYEAGKAGAEPLINSRTLATEVTFDSSLKATVNLQLVSGKSYDIVFWADSYGKAGNDEVYEFQPAAKSIKVHYTDANGVSNLKASDDYRDAFFAQVENLYVTGDMQQSVTLRRPFAQINVGTSDLAIAQAAGATGDIYASMTVSKAYDTLSLMDGAVSGDVTDLEYTASVICNNETFPFQPTTYSYLEMNYVLLDSQITTDVKLSFTGNAFSHNIDVPAVPVQRNYRTNIYGALLTSTVDYTIDINPGFNDPDFDKFHSTVTYKGVSYIVDPASWDGNEVAAPYVAPTGESLVGSAAQLAGLAAQVNGTMSRASNDYYGETIVLLCDVDLAGIEWTPVGTSSNKFRGSFDGNGHTIKNLKVTGNDSNVGLFGFTTDGTIQNFTIENAEVSGYLNVGAVAGCPYTSAYKNITVKGLVKVDGFAYVGGAFGKNVYHSVDGIVINAAEGSYVSANSEENGVAYRTYVGGLIGFMGEGGHTVSNCSSNIDVIGSTIDVGGLTGIAHYGNNFINCSVSGNVKVTAGDTDTPYEVGGIAGTWHNQSGQKVTLNNCSFTGTITYIDCNGVDQSAACAGNTLVGAPYSSGATGQLWIDGVQVK